MVDPAQTDILASGDKPTAKVACTRLRFSPPPSFVIPPLLLLNNCTHDVHLVLKLLVKLNVSRLHCFPSLAFNPLVIMVHLKFCVMLARHNMSSGAAWELMFLDHIFGCCLATTHFHTS